MRVVRSSDGVWTFTEREELRFDEVPIGSAFLLVRTPSGELLDLYLPVGIEASDVADHSLVERARRVLRRSLPM